MAAYLGREGRADAPTFLYAEFDEWWGVRLPDYRRSSLEESDVRAQHRFDWTMMYVC